MKKYDETPCEQDQTVSQKMPEARYRQAPSMARPAYGTSFRQRKPAQFEPQKSLP